MDGIDTFALPEHAYIPGRTPRHAEGFLDHVKRAAPAPTLDRQAPDNSAWIYSLRLLENGFYWEAHEVLEEIWRNASPNSRERYLVQGMIHIANAALKVRMQRPEAAERLARLALDCIGEAFGSHRTEPLMMLTRDRLMACARNCDKAGFSFTGVTNV